MSYSCLFIAAFCTTKLAFCSDSSGSSSPTTTPSNCSSKPGCVMVKLSSDTLTWTSGE